MRGSAASVVLALILVLSPMPASAASWGPVVKISGPGPAYGTPGAIAMAGSTIGVAWVERGSDQRWRLYFRRSTDSGLTWASRVLISGTGLALTVSMAGTGSRLDLVWNQAVNGMAQVWYVRSIDAGASWGTKQALSPASENADAPAVARDTSGRVAVVWSGGNPMLPPSVWSRVSSNGGNTFGAAQALNEVSSPAFPRVAIGLDGRIHVVYQDGLVPSGASETWYQRSRDARQQWTAPQRLATSTEGSTIAAAGRVVLIGYQRLVMVANRPERWVKYRRSIDNGATWESPKQLATKEGQNTVQPVFSVRNGRWRAIFVRCQTFICDQATIRLRSSIDKGVSWSSPRLVSPNINASNSPIGADGGKKAVVAWSRANASGNPGQVLVRRSN